MAKPTSILLLGAGELGTGLLLNLSSLPNTHITLGIRSPTNYTHLANPNTTLLPLDITSPSPHLSQTFSHYDILIVATGFGQTPASVLKLAHEVLEAGKLRKAEGKSKLWFFPWQWGVDYDATGDGQSLMPLFGAQRDVRELLRGEAAGANVEWTVVSTGIFMSFLFEPFWGVVDRSGENDGEEGKVVVRALRDWSHKVTVTDVRDIGRVLVTIVKGDVYARDKVVYVAGDTVSYGDLADIVARVSGKPVRKEAWSIAHLGDELRKDPDDGIKKYRLVFARDGVWWDRQKAVNEELGMNMMRVEDYAKDLFSR